jgi:Domain of unknown function (DUF4440)
MKRMLIIPLLAGTVAFGQAVAVHAAEKQATSEQVQQQLIALDKQWGKAGSDTATLNKILAENMLALGPNGEAQGRPEQVAASTSGPAGAAGSYAADEYKFETLTPDIVVMTHRGTTTEPDGKKESHRSLHVFQRNGGAWQVVASAQAPITAKP